MNLEQFLIDSDAQYEAAIAEYGGWFTDQYGYHSFEHERDVLIELVVDGDYTRAYELITRSIDAARDSAQYDSDNYADNDYEPGMDGEGSYWPR